MHRMSRIIVSGLSAVALSLTLVGQALAGGSSPDSLRIKAGPGVPLTQVAMAGASTVRDGAPSSRSALSAQVYRLADCTAASDAPCFFTITGPGSQSSGRLVSVPQGVTTLGATETIVCGVNVYNGFGTQIGRLQENLSVTWGTSYRQNPSKFNSGNMAGTAILYPSIGYSWQNLSGPVVNPGYGVTASNISTATSQGYFVFAGLPGGLGGSTMFFATTLTITRSGWGCS